MPAFDRITLDPEVMGGKPCIRGLRVTVGTVLGLLASGHSEDEILKAYPYLEKEDFKAALAYATWRVVDLADSRARILPIEAPARLLYLKQLQNGSPVEEPRCESLSFVCR